MRFVVPYLFLLADTTPMTSAPQLLLDSRGTTLRLGASVARGGEGEIFECAGRSDRLLKLFHAGNLILQKARDAKVRAMVSLTDLRDYPRLAWPQEPVFDAHGQVTGFTMRRVSGVTLVALTALALMKRRLPNWGPAHVCRVVHDIAAICRELEARQVFVGDINLGNFLVNQVSAEVTAIDCDSYQLTVAGQLHACRVFTPDYQSPEVLAHPERLAILGPLQFRYSCALLFFNLLTAGGHPYQIKNGRSPAENILAGRHFLGGKGVATGCTTAAIWERYRALPPRIMALFKRAFIAGHSQDPSARPCFEEWVGAFKHHYSELMHAA